MMDRSRSTEEGATLKRPRFLGMQPLNWIMLLGGIVAVLFGYALLARGSVTAAPLLLVLGYLVLIPGSFIAGLRRGNDEDEEGPGGE